MKAYLSLSVLLIFFLVACETTPAENIDEPALTYSTFMNKQTGTITYGRYLNDTIPFGWHTQFDSAKNLIGFVDFVQDKNSTWYAHSHVRLTPELKIDSSKSSFLNISNVKQSSSGNGHIIQFTLSFHSFERDSVYLVYGDIKNRDKPWAHLDTLYSLVSNKVQVTYKGRADKIQGILGLWNVKRLKDGTKELFGREMYFEIPGPVNELDSLLNAAIEKKIKLPN